jgi:hypothetical protein
LFEGLVHRAAVLGGHLVELVDRGDALVREHQGAGLETPLLAVAEVVPDGGGGEPGRGRPLAGGVHRPRRDVADVRKELGLPGAGVPDEQHVEVTADPGAVREVFGDARKQLQRHREFGFFEPIDRGRDRADDPLVDVLALGQLDDLAFVRVGDLHLLELFVLDLDADPVHVHVEHRRLLAVGAPLVQLEDADRRDVVAGGHPPADVVLDVHVDVLGRLAAAQALG